MAYLLILQQAVDFQIEISSFSEQLCSEWSSLKFETIKPQPFCMVLTWSWGKNGDWSLGHLHDNLQTISIDGSEDAVAKFAFWYRTIVPAKYKLFLCHDQIVEEIEITTKNTVESILEQVKNLA